ncbi:MAG: hypothetical protein HC933_12415, partial [Pleurocapsa sp. SU_196_0]|nr:hypothetical protein [Pleurocapsa sp. SU_196_0]
MRVQDVPGNRYQRSMQFLRLLGDALSWKTDRVALALFAHIATPQIRLTTDPNTLFFFLDHLDADVDHLVRMNELIRAHGGRDASPYPTEKVGAQSVGEPMRIVKP